MHLSDRHSEAVWMFPFTLQHAVLKTHLNQKRDWIIETETTFDLSVSDDSPESNGIP